MSKEDLRTAKSMVVIGGVLAILLGLVILPVYASRVAVGGGFVYLGWWLIKEMKKP